MEATAETVSRPEWLTLSDIAKAAQVAVEVVRSWCIQHENGQPDGLPSTHFGEKPPEEAGKKNRRVRRSDWSAFQATRERRFAREVMAEARAAERSAGRVPREYPARVGRRVRLKDAKEICQRSG